jgi:hypothetical protein
MGRRGIGYHEYLRHAQIGSAHQMGRKHPLLVMVWPYLPPVVGWLLVIVGLLAAWFSVPHAILAAGAAALGGLPLIFLGVRALRGSGAAARVRARARAGAAGMQRKGVSPAVTAFGFSIIMLAAAGLAWTLP